MQRSLARRLSRWSEHVGLDVMPALSFTPSLHPSIPPFLQPPNTPMILIVEYGARVWILDRGGAEPGLL